jgi:N-acetylglucosaminyldiphosphoundecaprenol N-acetyl-beta-D-mannosaminyltransferase
MWELNARRHAFRVEGITVNISSLSEAVTRIGAAARQAHSFCAFTLNLDHCTKLRSDPRFRAAYRRARFVTADGFPIALLGRLAGMRVNRTTGADLAEPVCAEAARSRLPIVLFGPNGKTLHCAKVRLRERIRGLEIADAFAPGPNFDPESPEADLAIERIRKSSAQICLVALGAPRQEIFAARCVDMVPAMGIVCVGAALDFIAGTETRAPPFFQNNGLEWLWRLLSNPRRLGVRYLRCAAAVPRLIAHVIPQALSARRGQP